MAPDERLSLRPAVAISDPAFESEGVRFLTIFSSALSGRGDISLYVPEHEDGAAPLPVVILLHGVYGSHWAWFFNGGAHRTAARMIASGEIRPFILAAPSDGLWGDGSGYFSHDGHNFEDWIVRDVLSAVLEPSVGGTPGAPVFLCGLSMGGYGALRLAMKHPRIFHGVSAHSSMTAAEQMAQFTDIVPNLNANQSDNAGLLTWAEGCRATGLPIRFDCGTGDFLLEANRRLSRELGERGISHRYEEFAGGHEWSYWQQHLADSLLFFEEALRRAPDRGGG